MRRPLTALILTAAAAPRVWAAVADQGVFWPDEVQQTLEQAHRFAFGYGNLPWEWIHGFRSWLLPGLLGLLWKAAPDCPSPVLVIGTKLLVVALGVAGVWAGMKLAERLAGEPGAILAGLLAAAFPASIFFGARVFTDTVSGPMILFAALLAARRPAAAGALAAAALFVKYQSAVAVLALFASVCAARRWRDALRFALAGLGVALLGGALDWLTWGRPFASLLAQLELGAGGAAKWGTAPPLYYLSVTWNTTGPAALAIGAGLIAAARRAPGLVAVVVAHVAFHSLIAHKEYRFMMAVLPLALALAGAGLAHLRIGVRGAWLLGAALAALMSLRTPALTCGDLGHPLELAPEWAPERSAWHIDEGVNRMLWLAGEAPDLCALENDTPFDLGMLGGYTYLHRNVPILRARSGGANYVLSTVRLAGKGTTLVGQSRGVRLYRRDRSCQP